MKFGRAPATSMTVFDPCCCDKASSVVVLLRSGWTIRARCGQRRTHLLVRPDTCASSLVRRHLNPARPHHTLRRRMKESKSIVVIGGGLIGLATARALLRADPTR